MYLRQCPYNYFYPANYSYIFVFAFFTDMIPPNALTMLNSKVSLLLTSMKCSFRSNYRLAQDDAKHPLKAYLKNLLKELNSTSSKSFFNTIYEPFDGDFDSFLYFQSICTASSGTKIVVTNLLFHGYHLTFNYRCLNLLH